MFNTLAFSAEDEPKTEKGNSMESYARIIFVRISCLIILFLHSLLILNPAFTKNENPWSRVEERQLELPRATCPAGGNFISKQNDV